SELVTKYHPPPILLTINPQLQLANPSATTIPAFHLFTHSINVTQLFTHFPPHPQPPPITLPIQNIQLINQTL
ncbi:hypothetical protein, partial [Virgibacillus sp. SK37]|uniref:hypothetical protein n=1 Tax=Virgibacillus sp. SK37 TaxID=403957 RepID=UPI001B30E851